MQGMSRKPKNDIVAYYRENPEEIVKAAARVDLLSFARYMMPKMDVQTFNRVYYNILNLFAHGKIKKLIVTMPPQHGKEISDNELVPTPKGFVKHGDLNVGDCVFSPSGEPIKVLWKSEKVQSEYVITFSDGQTIECHGNHEWRVYDRSRQKYMDLETKHIANSTIEYGTPNKRGHRYRFQLENINAVQFERRNVIIDPYTLGAWLGDGTSSGSIIHIGNNDVEIIDNIPYKTNENVGTTTRKFHIHDFTDKLREYNLLENKHIPEDYIYNSIEVRKNLIAGLIDTDGTVYQKNGRVTISNTNKDIINSAALILKSLGQNISIFKIEPALSSSGIQGTKDVYQLCFNPTMEFPTKVPRKAIRRVIVNRRKAIVKIEEKEGLGFGNCIQVEGGIYLVGENFIPTHNSEGSSRKLPAFLLGLNPDLKVVIGSYATSFARDFNRDVQKIIDTKEYRSLFPETRLAGAKKASGEGVYQRNSDVIDCVGHAGSLRVVGRGGPLTGKPVDIMILDDVYKDYSEANSPVVRESAWKWYTTVVKTRLHNNSQEIIVFTRWHNEDIVGKLEGEEKIIDIKSEDDLKEIPEGAWVRINFEAIKTGEKTEFDKREKGEALWPQRHSIQTLIAKRNLDKVQFECLYQGNPASAEGRLYQPFKTYTNIEDYGRLLAKGNYTDVADKGTDFLCSICYDKRISTSARDDRGNFCIFLCVTDIIYTDAPIEETTQSVPMMLNRNGTEYAYIEANNGGRAFTKIIEPRTKSHIRDFTQTANKESRIITNAGLVTYHIIMPYGWETRFPKAYNDVTGFLRKFTANEHDDIEDVLSGMVEKEINGFSVSPAELQATEDYIDY